MKHATTQSNDWPTTPGSTELSGTNAAGVSGTQRMRKNSENVTVSLQRQPKYPLCMIGFEIQEGIKAPYRSGINTRLEHPKRFPIFSRSGLNW